MSQEMLDVGVAMLRAYECDPTMSKEFAVRSIYWAMRDLSDASVQAWIPVGEVTDRGEGSTF